MAKSAVAVLDTKNRLPWYLFFGLAIFFVVAFTGSRPTVTAVHLKASTYPSQLPWQPGMPSSQAITPASIPPPSKCGDGNCDPAETIISCGEDCPGVTTPDMCGEEPHSDPGGYAVVWGASHKTDSAAGCCDACAKHASDRKNAKRPCNSWVFCYAYPQCWSLDTGNWHGFGEWSVVTESNQKPLCPSSAR